MVLYLVSTYFVVPYFYEVAAAQDPSGQTGAFVGASFLITFAGGLYLGGIMSEHLGFSAMGWIALVANMANYVVFLAIEHRGSDMQPASALPTSQSM